MGNPDPIRDAMHAKITEADNIVFVHPMWWVSMPAIMKNFIDVNISARFAFKYVNGNPVGLLKGKTACVFITADGVLWKYMLIAMPFYTIWRFGVLELCGLKVKAFRVFYKKFARTEADQARFLEKVRKIAQKIR
jgi:NAD(P)H dehydrogenase (quinone)